MELIAPERFQILDEALKCCIGLILLLLARAKTPFLVPLMLFCERVRISFGYCVLILSDVAPYMTNNSKYT